MCVCVCVYIYIYINKMIYYNRFLKVILPADWVLFLVLPSLLSCIYLSANIVFWKAVPTQDVTIPVSLPSFFTVCRIFLTSLTLFNTSSFTTRSVQLISSSSSTTKLCSKCSTQIVSCLNLGPLCC